MMSEKLFKILKERKNYSKFRQFKDDGDFKCLTFEFKDDGVKSTYGEEDLVLEAFFPYSKDPYGIEFTQYKEKYYGDKFNSKPIILSFFEMDKSSYESKYYTLSGNSWAFRSSYESNFYTSSGNSQAFR